MTCNFTMTLHGDHDVTALMDMLAQAGITDATVSVRYGMIHLAFAREAETMFAATNQAYRQLEALSLSVMLLTMDDEPDDEPEGATDYADLVARLHRVAAGCAVKYPPSLAAKSAAAIETLAAEVRELKARLASNATPPHRDDDPIGREIERLFAAHPEFTLRIAGGVLRTMDEATKLVLLGDVRRMMGIDPDEPPGGRRRATMRTRRRDAIRDDAAKATRPGGGEDDATRPERT